MNRDAIAFAPIIGRCACGSSVRLGEMGVGMLAYHHYGCGDIVELFSTRTKSIENPLAEAVIIESVTETGD